MKRRVLGKGLDALLPESSSLQSLLKLDIDQIQPNPLQPRVSFDSDKLEELARSIAQSGILQPIVVRPASDGYEIVAGERRWRAAQRAGLTAIPCIVQDASDREMLELALVENVQRDDLSAIEEAQAYRLMVEQFGLKQAKAKSRKRSGAVGAAVANTLRLLQLPRPVQQMVIDEELSMGHARALLPLPEADQLRSQPDPLRYGFCPCSRAGPALAFPSSDPKAVTPSKDANVLAAERRLEETWKTRVEIRQHGHAGEIVFDFHSTEELQRLFEELLDL